MVTLIRKTLSGDAALVEEAKQIREVLRRYDSPAANKLSRETFIAEALKVANMTRAEADALRQRIEADSGHAYEATVAFLRQAVKFITEGTCTRPPKAASRLTFMLRVSSEGEMASLGAGPLQVFAVASLIAAEKHPEAFGTIKNWDEHIARLAQLRQRLMDLRAPVDARIERLTLELAWAREARKAIEG